MAVDESQIHFVRSIADGADFEQFFPNRSLGGFRANTVSRIYYQGTLTAGMSTVNTLVDSAAIDDRPVSPDPRTPVEDSGGYARSQQLVHWYRPGFDRGRFGHDWATAPGTRRDLAVANLTASNLSAFQPGQFDQARKSLTWTGAAGNQALRQTTAVTFGLANAWAIGVWCRPATIAAGQSYLVNLVTDPTIASTTAVNNIRIFRDGAGLEVRITDSTTGTNAKVRTYASFFTAGDWVSIILVWSGSTLSLYKNGSLLAPSTSPSDAAVTQTDAARAAILGGRIPSAGDPQNEWDGQIHSVLMWSATLDASAAVDVDAMGDGPGPIEWDFTGQWAVFVTGPNRMQARKVTSYDRATGTFRFADGFTSLGALGNAFRVSLPQFLWDDGPTPAECAAGHVDFRAIVVHNNSGENFSGGGQIKAYLVPLEAGSIELDIAVGSTAITTNAFVSIANDDTPPNLDPFSPSGQFQRFRRPRSYAQSDAPAGSFTSWSIGGGIPIYLRRTTRPLTRHYVGGAFLLVVEPQNAQVSGAGPWYGVAPISIDPAGFTPDLALALDRMPRTIGGARAVATLRDAASGIAIEDEEVRIELVSGVGSIEGGTFEGETDEHGQAVAIYRASDAENDAGTPITVRASIGGP